MELTLEDARRSLARTPAILRAMVTGLPDRWLDANEGEGTFTVRDVLGHLVSGEGDSEGADWIPRFRLILEHGESRPFVAFDRTMFRARWARASAPELLDAFAGARAESLALFDGLELTAADFVRTGTHPDFGRVTLGQLLATWVAHDLTHVSQITRVIAKQYAEAVGPWRERLRVVRD